MNSHKLSALLDYCKTHLSQKRCRTILVALACVVVFGTTYALILPAVTMTTVCGLEEHEHTDDCYEEVLVCGEEEGEDHQHDASCYERELVCGQEEHQHTEDCYAHDDEDDTEDSNAQDPDAEEEPDEPEEEPEVPAWADDLPDLTGNWAEDVAAIAQSQEGTDAARYGDWYTETYGAEEDDLDTTAPFVAFCLYYAEVDEDALPREANSEAWYETLEDAFGDETPAPGDLLFYEQDGTRMGIVTDVDVSDEDEYTYTVVESDLDGEVGESERLSGADILAYVPLPENPDENGGSTEEPDEPDRPSDNDQDRDTTGDNDRADDTGDSDRDTTGGDKSDASGDNAGQKDEDPADEPAETPEEDPDTLPTVPKDALSARLADGSMQVTVETTPCQNPEHEHDSDEAYYADEPAYGVITVAATNAEPPEEDTAALYVSLNFSNEHGSVTAEPDTDYSYTLTKTGTTYTFDLPRPAPGTQVEIPFTVQYETSLDHGGTATLWCSNQANPAVAPQAKPQATKTLTWAVYEANTELLPAGTYGSYIFKHNTEKNGYKSFGSEYFDPDHPFGVAGNFHIVAFNDLRVSADCNGNVLANNFYGASQRVATRDRAHEISYIIHAKDFSPNVGNTEHNNETAVLVLGSDNKLVSSNNGNNISIVNQYEKKIEHPKTIIQDEDSTLKPFIDLNEVKAQINTLSQRLAEQPQNGVIANFEMNSESLTIPSPDGAYYYKTDIDTLNEFVADRELKLKGFQSNHNGSLIVTVDCNGHQGQKVIVPCIRLYVDGAKHDTGSEPKTFEYGKVIFNFINAKGVTLKPRAEVDTTIIAPGATVVLEKNIDGSIIAENVTVKGGESHRTDFTGTLEPANVNMQCKKQVDGKTPSADQVFNFVLQEWNGTEWKDIKTATNFYENINFNVSYTKESDVREHWYCVYEKADKKQTEYTYDSTHYYIKVNVSGEKDPLNNTQLKAEYTYYTTSSDGAITTPDHTGTKLTTLKKHDDMVFRNTTDKTLPSTGGPGEWTIPSIGLLLMAGSLLVVTKQRPQRKEDR